MNSLSKKPKALKSKMETYIKETYSLLKHMIKETIKVGALRNTLAVFAIVLTVLITTHSPWHFVDIAFFFSLHAIIAGILLYPIILLIITIIYLLQKVLDNLPAKKTYSNTVLLVKVTSTKIFFSSVFSSLFTLHCFALFASIFSLSFRLSIDLICSAIATDGILKYLIQTDRYSKFVMSTIAAITVSLLSLIFTFIITEHSLTPVAIPIIAVPVFVASLFNKSLLCANKKTPWYILHNNRIFFGISALVIIAVYNLFAPTLYNENRPVTVAFNRNAGSASDEIFTPDGKSIILLDKAHNATHMIDRKSLKILKTIFFDGYPRDIEFDIEKNQYYIVVHNSLTGNLSIISADTFEILNTTFFKNDECTMVNAVFIDYTGNRILLGCDDTGNVFAINRDTLEAYPEPLKPDGSGIVRIIGGKQINTAITSGCVLGPYVHVIDLKNWKLLRKVFTGLLTWEMLRDEENGFIYLSVPFRSLIVVLNDKTLKIVSYIPTGLGARAMALDKNRNLLFVGNQISSTVDVIDLKTHKKKTTFYLLAPRYFLYSERDQVLYAGCSDGLYKIDVSSF